MTSLTMMGLTPVSLVHTILLLFLYVLTITLIVLGDWGLAFLYQQESSPNVIFLRFSCLYQWESNPKVVNLSKCFGAQIPCSLSNFETQFYSYSHDLTLLHSFLPLLLYQKHNPAHSNGINIQAVGFSLH